MTNRSSMVRWDTWAARCSECGAEGSGFPEHLEIRFRFAKDKIVLCAECWAELAKQVVEHEHFKSAEPD